jgi:hypothetical protein
MSLTAGSKAIGTHVLFFPETNTFTKDVTNSTVSATPASRTAKPGSSDTGWIDIGVIDGDFKLKPASGQEVKIMKPSPGRLRLYDVLQLKEEVSFSFTLSEINQLAMEIMYKGALGMTGQFTPLEGSEKRGWIKLEQYDQADAQFLIGDFWAILNVTGDVDFGGGDIVKPAFEAKMLFSTLNTFTL